VAPSQLNLGKKHHKRVYSIGSNQDLDNQRASLNNTPLGIHNHLHQNKMGFGFGGMP